MHVIKGVNQLTDVDRTTYTDFLFSFLLSCVPSRRLTGNSIEMSVYIHNNMDIRRVTSSYILAVVLDLRTKFQGFRNGSYT